ncbi:hypothetical protein BT67DRAFT_247839 [Trichocladium antarcticum]|uniref:Uncharacterized protein n=1 Tax=Trichocladium antarcticum TaxID=1450529 RepID=A0AAN6UCE8_9PEZI|nr:hypothetical protein BT67DRAFT_247839 [Trichocladium antarcticum]
MMFNVAPPVNRVPLPPSPHPIFCSPHVRCVRCVRRRHAAINCFGHGPNHRIKSPPAHTSNHQRRTRLKRREEKRRRNPKSPCRYPVLEKRKTRSSKDSVMFWRENERQGRFA